MAEVRSVLSITGAGEDYPRLLTGYRRLRGGRELVVLLRPTEGKSLVIRAEKSGAVVQEAIGWPTGRSGAVESALSRLKAMKQAVPTAGPTTMRGKWSGRLLVDAEARSLRIELTRRIASYGALTVTSDGDGWSWRFERAQKWFTQGGQSASKQSLSSLQAAIDAGYDGARGLVREACGFRDTRRRASFDTGYAERHPIKPARVVKDRTTSFIERERKIARQKRKGKQEPCDTCAADLRPVEQGAPAAPAPKTMRKATTAAKKVLIEAEAIQAATPGEGSIQVVHDWFVNTTYVPGYIDLAEKLHDYAHGRYKPEQAIPVKDFVAGLGKEARALLKADGRDSKDATWKATTAQLKALEDALTTAPSLLARTRALLRYTTAILDSPKCTGAERKEAQAAYDKAFAEYERARLAFVEGRSNTRQLRKAAEWVALSAAKAGAACGAGQRSLTAMLKASPKARQSPATFRPQRFTLAVPQSSNKKVAFAAAQQAVLGLIKPASARGMVTFEPAKRGSWTLEMRAESALVASALEKGLPGLLLSAPTPKTPRRARPRKAKGSGLSAEKTTLLSQAFSSAIADVVRQMRAGA